MIETTSTPAVDVPRAPWVTARLRDPAVWVTLYLAAFFLAWAGVGVGLNLTPPSDNLEQISASVSFEWAYEKHPPLPSWITFALARLFGPSIALTYIAGAACTTLTLALLYGFARGLLNPERAGIAVLLASLVAYYNYKSLIYNHNIVQLPFAMAAIWAFWSATQIDTRRAAATQPPSLHWKSWTLLGVFAALTMIAKYSAVMLFAACALNLIVDRRQWRRSTLFGVIIAIASFTVVVAPHALAVLRDGSSAVGYATAMVFPEELGYGQRLGTVQRFIGSQFGHFALPFAVGALAWIIGRRRDASSPAAPKLSLDADHGLNRDARRQLTVLAFGPLLVTLAFAVLTGARLLSGWGAAFVLLLPIWAVACLPALDGTRVWTVTLIASVLAQAAFVTLVGVRDGACNNPLRPARCQRVDLRPLAQTIEQTWRAQTGQPLTYVAADLRTSGALTIALAGRARIVPEGDPNVARWVDRRQFAACGITYWMQTPRDDPNWPELPAHLRDGFTAASLHGTADVAGVVPGQATVRYYWAIEPPAEPSRCGWLSQPR